MKTAENPYRFTAGMRLPRLLLALIDPASAAMDSRNWSRRRPLYRGGAVFGSGVPGGSRQATPEEIEAIRRHSQQQQRAEGSPVGSHPHSTPPNSQHES
jgi:hypothetical protein